MTTSSFNNMTVRIATAMAILLCISMTVMAGSKSQELKYTEERPLRIVSDWDFAPYEYGNDKGKPEGYNIDVIKAILDKLDIPHVFLLKEWSQAVKMFNAGEADLIVEPFNNIYKYGKSSFYSRKTLAPYKIKIAYKRGTRPITRLNQMSSTDKLTLKKYDYATMIIFNRSDIDKKQLRFWSPKVCLQELNSGRYQYFVWGEKPLERMLKELNMNSIELGEIDIPAGDMRFISHDKELIDKIDDQFARLEQSGTIHKMRNKWFHPELQDDDASPLVLPIIIIAIIIVIVIFAANRIMMARIKKNTQHSFEKNKMMQEALNMSGNSVICLDLRNNHVYNIYGNHLPPEGMPARQYAAKIHPDDLEGMTIFADEIVKGNRDIDEHLYRWNAGTDEHPQWLVMYNRSISERNKSGKIINIISTLTDITAEKSKEREDGELTAKYSNIFEMSIVGLALYDSKGYLIKSNHKMRDLLKFDNPMDELYFNKCLFDFTPIKDVIDPDDIEEVHFCTKAEIPERGVSEYLEMRIRPISNENGETIYILVTARAINEERNIYCQRQENNAKLRAVNSKIARSEDELRYLLEESNTKVWRSSFADRTMTFYKDLRHQNTCISFDEFVGSTFNENDRNLARDFIEPADSKITPKTIVLAVNDIFTACGQKRWYSINRIPEYDDDGHVTGCFGLIRDVTELMEAQEKLKEETQRANESEQQKSVFLANMSHEIRTPLNAIMGFCDLLQSVDSPDDRKEFIRIIRNNCNMLLHLINDILIISSMDADGLTIEPREVDFSDSFDDVCATFTQQIAEAGVSFIKDNPYKSLRVRLDNDRIQQVIINFMTNAIKHTRQGHIRMGYRIEDGGMYIYCEDTGSGIPKEKCEDVFKRFVKLNEFVQGTGLGLSICKAIADSCGGRIGVESEIGKGATFWMWIPCDIINIEPQEDNAKE